MTLDIDALLDPAPAEPSLVALCRAAIVDLADSFLGAVARRDTAGLPFRTLVTLGGARVLLLGTWKRDLRGQRIISNAAVDGCYANRQRGDRLLVVEHFARDSSGARCSLYALPADGVRGIYGIGHYSVGPVACRAWWSIEGDELVAIDERAYRERIGQLTAGGT